MIKLLHISKTAGTALKNALKDAKNKPFSISNTHSITLLSLDNNVGFILRDPWQRFASGFWERKTLKMIREVRRDRSKLPFKYKTGGMGVDYTQFEKDIFNVAFTPNDLITLLKNNPEVAKEFNHYEMDTPQNNLGQVCASYTYWLGDLDTYKENEHKVSIVIDQKSLTAVMKNEYNITMHTDPYIARTREQFDIEQSYDITPENLAWFKQWRSEDYALIEYITQQPYYRT